MAALFSRFSLHLLSFYILSSSSVHFLYWHMLVSHCRAGRKWEKLSHLLSGTRWNVQYWERLVTLRCISSFLFYELSVVYGAQLTSLCSTAALKLGPASSYAYLNSGDCCSINGVDDADDFHSVLVLHIIFSIYNRLFLLIISIRLHSNI